MKIFRDSVVIDLCVLANDEKEAAEIMADSIGDEFSACYFGKNHFSPREVTEPAQLSNEWQNSVPYSQENSYQKTIKDFFENQN